VRVSGNPDIGFKMSYMSHTGKLDNFPIQVRDEGLVGNGQKILPMAIQIVVPSSDPDQAPALADLASAASIIRERSA